MPDAVTLSLSLTRVCGGAATRFLNSHELDVKTFVHSENAEEAHAGAGSCPSFVSTVTAGDHGDAKRAFRRSVRVDVLDCGKSSAQIGPKLTIWTTGIL